MLSIVIPTYNDGQYIEQCLNSIINQTYSDFEAIVIVDGSTDNTIEIVKGFCEKDSRISYYFQENSGAGPARNNGISHANGEYVMFVDADDWLAANAAETLMKLALEKEVDWVIGSAIQVRGNANESSWTRSIFPDEFVNTREDVINSYIRNSNTSGVQSPWGKLYKMSVINDNNLKFPDMRRSQDVAFNYLFMSKASSIQYSSIPVYFYRLAIYTKIKKTSRRLDTNTLNARKNYINTIVFLKGLLEKIIVESQANISVETQKLMQEDFIRQIWNAVNFANVLPYKQLKEIAAEATNNEQIVSACSKYDGSGKYKILCRFIVGKNNTMICLYVRIIGVLKKSRAVVQSKKMRNS